ncbi:MAG: hypothetical protein SAJ37_02310 [Oscillatoria sp. PMC 1068.18]|nr:hypothetical protein [Oscillatoria sp. PMC 1068.18]
MIRIRIFSGVCYFSEYSRSLHRGCGRLLTHVNTLKIEGTGLGEQFSLSLVNAIAIRLWRWRSKRQSRHN